MEEKDRQEKHAIQTEELYAAIGRFAVKFEHVCHVMSSTIVLALQSDGLRTQSLANAVSAGLTADPLRKIFGAILAEARDDDENDKKIITNVLTRVQRLTERRNDVIHRTWFVGWASLEDQDFAGASGFKFVNTNKGVEFRDISYTVSVFDDLSAEADELSDIIQRMSGCLMLGKRYYDNFKIDPDGTVRRGPRS
jgi:hypothetical protein